MSRAALLLVVGPALAIAATLADVKISETFAGPSDLARTLTYYLIGTCIGVVAQGALAVVADRRQPLRQEIPLSQLELAACGVLDFVSVVSWLYALLTGHTAAVLALGSLAPVLVGGWEMCLGKLSMGRGLVGLGLILAGGWFLMRPASELSQALPPLCALALLIRNGTRALTEIWERKVPQAASYRFTGVRFGLMTALGIPCAVAALALTDSLQGAGTVLANLPFWVLPLQLLSHGLWFAVNVARVQAKQGVRTVTLPAAAFSTPAAAAALVASLLDLALPGSFPKASFSLPLLLGASFLVAGAAWFAVVRARGLPPSVPTLTT